MVRSGQSLREVERHFQKSISILSRLWNLYRQTGDVVMSRNSIKGPDLLQSGGSLLVTSHGSIEWLVTGTTETRCPINIYKFPFDTQTCVVVIRGWFGFYNNIRLSSEAHVDMKEFKENSEFEISPEDITNIDSGNDGPVIRITIHLRRRPLFYIFTVLLPVVLLYSLNPFVFLLPSQSGEKTSMAVSVLLSFQLFLSIIRDSLPENSLTVSLFSLYVTLANFTSIIIVVLNILLLKMKDALLYIFNILLPVVLLYFLDTFVTLLPSQSREKTNMVVSVLLRYELFLSIIRDSLPDNSLTVSLFSVYASLANFTIVVTVVVNVLLLKRKDKLPAK
ncbi:ligand-gated ion channel 4-like [Haliotis rufescens]|uniref:ligand-gated ion channel 4-like n=1 Tax=Haliotis rufescens TaxID=6454 RepID=UPI00201EFCB3|nr:ligand-gated ion channel 4-like [Haliotis rufescens]